MDRKLGHRAFLAAFLAVALAAAPTAASAARPEIGAARSATPHLLLIHGGSFLGEDPDFEARTAGAAIAAGFVPHYLEYPLGDLPGAVLAARAEARRLRGLYGDAVYAYGSSAGGTLAALLAGDGLVSAAVAKAPVTDLPTWEWPLVAYGPDYFERIGVGPLTALRLSPLRRPAQQPLLIVHGRDDLVVPAAMSEAFAAKFRNVHLWLVPGGHWTERLRPAVLGHAFAWLARTARAQAEGTGDL